MILQPVLHPLLLALVAVVLVGAAVWGLVRASGRGRLRWVARIALALLCVVVLLRPGVPGGESRTLTTDVDVFLVVDRTASIVAEDWGDGEPRLDGVRSDVQRIVDAYPGARFALITFDVEAAARVPLTTDTTAVMSALEVLSPEVTAQSAGSSIGIANGLLQKALSRTAEAAPDRARMVFYFGDGEQTVDRDPESFANSRSLVAGGAVFGYGTADGGPMRTTTGSFGEGADGGYIEYQGGQAMSVIDEDNLRTIAQQLGVEYVHRDADTGPRLPAAPTTTTRLATGGTTGNVIELYWIAAAGIVLLLAFELAAATAGVAALGRARTGTRRSRR